MIVVTRGLTSLRMKTVMKTIIKMITTEKIIEMVMVKMMVMVMEIGMMIMIMMIKSKSNNGFIIPNDQQRHLHILIRLHSRSVSPFTWL